MVTFLGAAVRLVVNLDGEEVISDVIEKEFEQRQLKQGDEVFLYFPPEAFMVYPPEGGFPMNRNRNRPGALLLPPTLESDRLLTGIAMGFPPGGPRLFHALSRL